MTEPTNFLIIFFNAFNLLFSSLILAGILDKIILWAISGSEGDLVYTILSMFAAMLQADSPVVIYGLGWFPLVFSLVFFLIPLVRSRMLKKQKENRRKTNIRKLIYRVVLKDLQGKPATAKQIADQINQFKKQENFLNYEQRCLIISAKGKRRHPQTRAVQPKAN